VHELSIVYSIVQTVTAALESDIGCQTQRVRSIRLQVGALAGVTIDALLFSYDLATEGTALAGSRLEIEKLPVEVYCPACDAIGTLDGIQSFRCPTCGTLTGDIRQGRELEIVSVEFDDLATAPPTAPALASH